MKKTIGLLIVIGIIAGFTSCVSGPPAMDGFPEDLGVVEPVVMFGEMSEGEHDSAAYMFVKPKALGVDAKGNIYAGSSDFDLSVFSSDGEFITLIGSRGDGKGQWMYPKGIDISKNGNIYVSDNALFKVMVFDSGYNLIAEFGEKKEGPGGLEDIGDLAVDADGNIYVSDDGKGIHVFDSDFNFVQMIGDPDQTEDHGYIAVNSKLNKIYISEDGNGQIDVYDTVSGDFLYDFGGLGPAPEQFTEDIEGITIGPWDLVMAVDEGRVGIKIYQEDGTFVTQFGEAGIYEGQMASSEGLDYDPKNKRIVLADEKNHRIQTFSMESLGF